MTDKAALDYKDVLEKVETRHKELMDKWGNSAQKIWSMYLADNEDIMFNILFSNTETMVPAVFSKKPIAKVSRRFDEARADLPAKAVQRMLTFCMDTNLPSYPSFMTTIEDSVLDSALAGQGIFRVRVEGKIAFLDHVEWNKYAWGFCTRWENKPWEAFAHDMTPDEIVEQFADSLSDAQKAEFMRKAGEYHQEQEQDTPSGEKKPSDHLRVWEMWDKRARKVHFLCACAENSCLETIDPPVKLQNFFTTPQKPLTFLHSTTDTLPRPIYKTYQQQAEELNELTARLRKIVNALKVRGIYASGIDDIPRIFEQAEDNTLIPSSAASQIVTSGKGLDAYIWLLPIDKLVLVARELYQAREACKGVIYEILGIGDILRGVTKASETLGAQQLKDKWGSLRINKVRERTSEFIREGLRLLADASVSHTPSDMWQRVTGIGLMPDKEATILRQTAPDQFDPMKSWVGVLEILQNDLSRGYLIDIEVNSSVDSEATQQKAEMAEFMNALGQTMAGLKDLMMAGPQGWEAGKAILLGVVSKFELGSDVEPLLRQLQPPQGGNPEQLKKMQQEVQKRMQEVAKREEGLKEEDSRIVELTKDLQQMLKDLDRAKQDVKDEEKRVLRDIEHAVKEGLMELREEELQLKAAKQEVVLAGKAAVQNNKMAGDQAAHKGQMAAGKLQQAGQRAAGQIQQATAKQQQAAAKAKKD